MEFLNYFYFSIERGQLNLLDCYSLALLSKIGLFKKIGKSKIKMNVFNAIGVKVF